MSEVKPGWKTTEFWLTVMTQVPVVIGLIVGVSNPITLTAGAVTTAVYTVGRLWAKNQK